VKARILILLAGGTLALAAPAAYATPSTKALTCSHLGTVALSDRGLIPLVVAGKLKTAAAGCGYTHRTVAADNRPSIRFQVDRDSL
jgi:hypothetical protein